MADRVLANPAITVHWNRQVADASGNGWLEAITLKDPGNGASEELPVKGLFYAIGHTPNTRLVRGQLEVDSHGYLATQAGRPETSLAGVYAAGDVADAEWRQGITAAGSGCQAALAAERWLTHHNLAVTVSHEPVDPATVGEPVRTATSDAENYDAEALWQKGGFALRKLYHDSSKPLLVVYSSPTCGPCHVLKPQLKRVLDELGGAAQGVEIDIEAEQEIASQAGVTGTPTVQLFHNKELKQAFKGVKQRSEFKAAIEALLGAPRLPQPTGAASRPSIAALNSLRCLTPRNCCLSSFWKNSCTVGVPVTPAWAAISWSASMSISTPWAAPPSSSSTRFSWGLSTWQGPQVGEVYTTSRGLLLSW